MSEFIKTNSKVVHVGETIDIMPSSLISLVQFEAKHIGRYNVFVHENGSYIVNYDGRSNDWILVSERLPINDDWVIVTILDESGDIPYKYSDFGWYLDVAKCWIVDSEQRTDVIAWMPLPEPYKLEEKK